MLLKKGSPIEIDPSPNSLCTSGNKVPNNTTKVAAINKILLPSSITSRDTASYLVWLLTAPARSANSNNEPPITTANKPKINKPRAGSVAKACTDTITPERTKKVPSKLKLKVE